MTHATLLIVVGVQAAAIVFLLIQRTRRIKVEGELREREERVRLIADCAPVMIWTARPDTTLDYLNRTCVEFTGLPMEKLRDEGWLDAVHPDDRDYCVGLYTPAFEARRPFFMEYRVRRTDGAYRWLLGSGVPKHGADGGFGGYIGCDVDITERKEAEARTLESQAALEASHREIQHLAGRLIEAQDAERSRIARDLHDDVSQQLAGVSIALGGLKHRMAELHVSEDLQADLRTLQQRTTALAQNVRNVSHDLHPTVLRHAGLVAAVTSYCADLQRLHSTPLTCSAEGDFASLAPSSALCLYRIAQEALRNVVAHSAASRADVRLLRTGDNAEITIVDDGKGFDVASWTPYGSLRQSSPMRLTLRVALVASAIAMATVGAAGAGPQATPEAQATPEPRATPDPFGGPASTIAVPTRDIFDIVRELRHKPPKAEPKDYKALMVAAAPVVSYNPASGFGIGVAGNVAFYKGFPTTTSISSVVASLIVTSKKQLLFNGKFDVSTADNDWVFQGDNRVYLTSQDTFGLGTSTLPEDAINTKYNVFRFYEVGYRRVYRRLYVGAGLLYNLHSSVKANEGFEAVFPDSPYVTYSEARGFDPDSQSSAGTSVSVLVDSRDGAINPSRGVYAGLEYQTFFEGFLGGTSSWQQLNVEARTYFRLSGDARHRLAFWLFGDLITGGEAPYFDLPATAMDTYGRSGRGYIQGRFRGQRMGYGELEYRWTVKRNGLLGIVAFLNTETLSNEDTGERLFDSFATGFGVGMRLMMNKRSKTNLAFDVGRGNEGETRIYFGVQEAF